MTTLYQKFVERFEDVTDLPPQTLGPFTPYYKRITKRLKIMPWPMLVFGSLLIVTSLYMLAGSTITLLVTLLQKGF